MLSRVLGKTARRQGISPILFNIYIEDLVEKFEPSEPWFSVLTALSADDLLVNQNRKPAPQKSFLISIRSENITVKISIIKTKVLEFKTNNK